MTPYQRAMAQLIKHCRDCQECREDRGGCDEGKEFAHYAYSLSPSAARMAAKVSAKEAA